MTRRLSRKRSIEATDQQGPVKRPKSQESETFQKYKPAPKYSTRHIPWEEQRRLGGEFAEAGKNCWPVLKILEEGLKGRGKRYLVAWRPHPETGEEFEPIWRSPSDVGDDLIASWEQEKNKRITEATHQKEKSAAPPARNRRVLPDSSDATTEIVDQQSDAAPSPPSLLSGSSVSGLEISETQEFVGTESPRVNIPPLPNDKHDYETIGSSQFSPSTNLFGGPSSEGHFGIATSHKTSTSSITPATSFPPASLEVSSSKPLLAHTSQPEASESSPHISSKRRSKLSRFVLSSQEDTETDNLSSSQSVRFAAQLPPAEGLLTSPKSPIQSRSSQGRHPRLPSPFPDAPTVHDSSSLPISRHIRRQFPVPQPVKNLGLQKRPKTRLELRTGSNSSPGEKSPGIESSILVLSHLRNIPDHTPGDLGNIIMASSDVNVAPVESAENGLFTQPNSDAFHLVHDAHPMNLTIHESIEDEPQSSADNSQLMNSKANSSQESLSNEREVETIDGIMIPVRPLFGPSEFAISLPAEGKVKSQYDEVIKLQKKAILRFISRTGSPGASDISNKKTVERNTMQDMLQQLNNTVTHTDLGLPMHTQYSLNSEVNAAYAEYAGTKFELLGYLVDNLKNKDCTLVLFAQGGPLQDLLEEYLTIKRVPVRRHDRPGPSQSTDSVQGVVVDLLATQSSKIVSLQQKPLFVIAFDVTFTVSDPQVKSLQEAYGEDLPIVHFLVTNSSEHVERCVPDTLTSNTRLKVVVRTTYLASRNLGGDITYVPEESDQPADGQAMDMSEFQRAVRKSPARRLLLIADVIATHAISGDLATDWPLGSMPELKLSELETPAKTSRAVSRTPQPRTARNSTPISRAATPVGKKRLLEMGADNDSKRQCLTPVRDLGPELGSVSTGTDEASETRKRMSALVSELASTKTALAVAERKQEASEAKAEEWQRSHADVMRLFEKERLKARELQKETKKLNVTVSNYKERDNALRNEKTALRQQLADTKAELLQARKDLISEGGDIAELENAREEIRVLTSKIQSLEKSVQSTKADFEFTRNQYQDASRLAMDRTAEVRGLEDQVEKLKIAADDNKRSLKAMNYQASLTMAMSRAEQFRLEVKNREALIKKLQEENVALKNRRGVQTRGSSIQPASSPGPRSRQASPAPTHLMPPSGSRTSFLRHER